MIDLPHITDSRGDLTFMNAVTHVPFDIKRLFFIKQMTEGILRANHAHRQAEEFLVAIAGSFEIRLDDGSTHHTIRLSDPHQGLYIPSKVWIQLYPLGDDAICLAAASTVYDAADYIDDYGEFCQLKRKAKPSSLGQRSAR
jgi:dTDP-4-dehydrorhamnose 3,5-epimerase-like enzyme